MKFNLNDYQDNYVMHCKTKEEAENFCRFLHQNGGKWCTGDSYLDMIGGITTKETPCIASMRVCIVILNMPEISITKFLNGAILWKMKKP